MITPIYIVRDYNRNTNLQYAFADINEANKYIRSLGNDEDRYGLVEYKLCPTTKEAHYSDKVDSVFGRFMS